MSHHQDRMRHHMHDAWPALDSWQVQLTKGNVRIGDTERDDAARALGEHFAVGRLDRGEYDERMDAVFAAKTWGDLTPVFRDLPSPALRVPQPASQPMRRPHRSRHRLPFLPLLLLLIGVSVLAGTWWVFWLGLAAVLLVRRSRHSRGSWRPPRGSWS
jgi:hypothetical protein